MTPRTQNASAFTMSYLPLSLSSSSDLRLSFASACCGDGARTSSAKSAAPWRPPSETHGDTLAWNVSLCSPLSRHSVGFPARCSVVGRAGRFSAHPRQGRVQGNTAEMSDIHDQERPHSTRGAASSGVAVRQRQEDSNTIGKKLRRGTGSHHPRLRTCARPLPCTLGCVDQNGDPVLDEMAHCVRCEILWASAGRAAGDGPGRSAIERVALGDAIDFEERVGAVARLICAFSMYQAVKVPWAAALPSDGGDETPMQMFIP